MLNVHLKVGDNTLAVVTLDVLPRVGDLLSFSAPPRPDFWSPETEEDHRALGSCLWVVSSVVHFINRKDANPIHGTTQFVNVYLDPAEQVPE